MHETTITMKDGRKYSGPIWSYRPKEGYLMLAGAEEKLFFRDMESCVTLGTREYAYNAGTDRDELARARKDGWDGS
jgi:hypothetical protein